MYVYKCIQSRSTCELLVYLIRTKPLLAMDAAFMHYKIIDKWKIPAMGM